VRVAHVVHHYGRLSESFIPDALEQLDRAGAEAWVATLSVENRATYPFPPDERLLVCPPPPRWQRAVDRLRGRSGATRFAAAAARRLAPLRPAVVHAQFGWAAESGVALARRLGLRCAVTFHGTDVTTVPVRAPDADGWRGPRRHPYGRALAGVDLAIAVSKFIAAKLRALGFGGTIEIVPAGVDLEELTFRAAEPAGPAGLLYLGRLNPQKGPDLLLRALPAVLERHPQALLEVLGGGPSATELERLAGELGVAGNVRFLGPLPGREPVVEALGRAHVLVMPSRAMPDGQAEGSPVVTKEAQAVGVALVATDTGGIAETVPPAHRPELAPGDDPAALAARVSALLDDPEARRRRAVEARRWVEEQFDQRRLAERTAALYARLADH
jgi:colanic acid/amylovoran biosynthesis glycosyltransferase